MPAQRRRAHAPCAMRRCRGWCMPCTIPIRLRPVAGRISLRVAASKRFLLFGFAAGVGRDEIEGVGGLRAIVNETVQGTPARASLTFPTLREKVTRNTAFVNGSFGLPVARIVAEYGRSSAGTLRQTLNTFGGRQANETYTYGSVGITVRF